MKRADRDRIQRQRHEQGRTIGYQCQTCGEQVADLAAARAHAKQGFKTQRLAFLAGQLHALELSSTTTVEA